MVPDALSWRKGVEGGTPPKGPAAWSAASVTDSGRTVVDAGPYGIIDLAQAEPWEEVPQLGVVWWDKRSFRAEDDDFGTIQTSFVPASTADHVSLAPRPDPTQAVPSASSSAAPDPAPTPTPTAYSAAAPGPAAPMPAAPPVGAPPVAAPSPDAAPTPVPAARPAPPDDSPKRTRHARRSRHVALVPKGRGARRLRVDDGHPRRAKLRRRRTRRRTVLGAVVLVVAFAVTLLVQTMLVTPFTVPSSSMENTLFPGDRIAVNRLAYASAPIQRGDVVVFRDPGGWLDGSRARASTGDFLVKRVIGIPGDKVTCCSDGGRVTVNGRELSEAYAVIPAGQPAAGSSFDVTVPAGSLWVLGDNRLQSRDSSRTQDLPTRGFVPIADVVGQAAATFWPLNHLAPIPSGRETFSSIPDTICPI
ncbi:signal peptidase I [Leifsonia poae]|uniref:signal peptidase I n=1 Tax=Leifsonia poae TaxID=110933 RepID=UPI003D69C21B